MKALGCLMAAAAAVILCLGPGVAAISGVASVPAGLLFLGSVAAAGLAYGAGVLIGSRATEERIWSAQRLRPDEEDLF